MLSHRFGRCAMLPPLERGVVVSAAGFSSCYAPRADWRMHPPPCWGGRLPHAQSLCVETGGTSGERGGISRGFRTRRRLLQPIQALELDDAVSADDHHANVVALGG